MRVVNQPARYILLRRIDDRPFDNVCPACDGRMDATGCVVGERVAVHDPVPGRRIGEVVEILCAGRPVGFVHDCPCCTANHPAGTCE